MLYASFDDKLPHPLFALQGIGERIATTSVRTGLAMTYLEGVCLVRAANDRPYMGRGMRIAATSVRTGLAMTYLEGFCLGRAANDRPYKTLTTKN